MDSKIAFLLFLASITAQADPIQVTDLDVEYHKFIAPGNDSVIWPQEHKDSLNLRLNVSLYNIVYFDSKIVSEADKNQFRMVGLHMNYGFHLSRYFDIEYAHVSEHVLDAKGSMPGYPLYDSVGIILHLMPKKE